MKRKNDFSVSPKALLRIAVAFAVLLVGFILLMVLSNRSESYTPSSRMPVVFSEIMTSNGSTVKAPDGDFYDYFELHNESDEDVSLTGCSVVGPDGEKMFVFPSGTVIKADEYLVIWCGKDKSSEFYADFKLNKAGNQTLTLRDSSASTVDTVTTPVLEAGKVYSVDGDTDLPTPGFANTQTGRAQYIESLSVSETTGLEITEIAPNNHGVLADGDGDYPDWFELHNASDSAIRLKDFTATDTADDLYQWAFPDITLEPDAYLVVFCSGKDKTENGLHTSFKLSGYGETITICDKTGHTCLTVTCPALGDTTSYAKIGDAYYEVQDETPGYPNTNEGIEAFAKTKTHGDIVISEAMSKNNAVLPLNGKQYYDWVELQNVSNHDVNLSEYYLSDDFDEHTLWQCPDVTLKAGERIVFICSGETGLSNSEYRHTSFKINGDEEIFLYKNDTLEDSLCLKDTAVNGSMGRLDGMDGVFYLTTPTPGTSNDGKNAARSVSLAPVFTTASGIYNDTDGVTVFIDAPGTVHYVLYYGEDGGKTSKQSDEYTYDKENGITLTKTTAVRAYSTEDGKAASDIVYGTYIINENHTLDVMSLTLTYEDMWSDETGIYTNGPNDKEDNAHHGANFWYQWERTGQADLYCADGSEGFTIPCGVKIFGGYSRILDKKSFQLKFRSLYGAGELNYNVFDNGVCSFESLVVRSGSQDYSSAMLRDEWLTGLAAKGGLNVTVQSYRPVILYVNGAYFGIYYLREKVGADFISKHTNVSEESVNLVECNHRLVEGSNQDYVDILTYAKTHNLAKDECYQYICSKIDIDSLIDYKIAEFFSGNQDTGNIRFYMSQESDGKWRWILYDLDYAYYYYSPLYRYTTHVRQGYYEVNLLMTRLIKNEEFVDRFIKRCAELFKTVLSSENVIAELDSLAAIIRPEMARNCTRWNFKYEDWEATLEKLKYKTHVKLGEDKFYHTSDENGYAWSLYAMIKDEFNLTKAQMKEYFGDVNY